VSAGTEARPRSDAIVFVSHFRLKAGTLKDLRRLFADVSGSIETEKQRTLAYLCYVDEESGTATFVHVFADAASMNLHFEGADERSKAAAELLDPAGWEIYGTPSEEAISTLRQAAAASGVKLTVGSHLFGGFIRFPRGRG
jgi:sugar/nucleoside kinase (ribokinase family)